MIWRGNQGVCMVSLWRDVSCQYPERWRRKTGCPEVREGKTYEVRRVDSLPVSACGLGDPLLKKRVERPRALSVPTPANGSLWSLGYLR